jgi:hypothetical protein
LKRVAIPCRDLMRGTEARGNSATSELDFVTVFGNQAFENARSPPKPPAAPDARATE